MNSVQLFLAEYCTVEERVWSRAKGKDRWSKSRASSCDLGAVEKGEDGGWNRPSTMDMCTRTNSVVEHLHDAWSKQFLVFVNQGKELQPLSNNIFALLVT